MNFTRRNFLATAALSSASVALGASAQSDSQNDGMAPMKMDMGGMKMSRPKAKRPDVPRLPALICRMTNTVSVDAAYQMLVDGKDPLEAALHLTKMQENDPNDFTNGLGGLPNQDGEVQLDAAVWHGPSRRAAAIASVSGIKNASLLAQALMQRTGYSMLSGSDAQSFALANGFTKENLLTERSRSEYAVWKQLQKNPPQLKSAIYDPNWPETNRKSHFLSGNQKDYDFLIRDTEPLAVKAGIIPQYTWKTASDTLFPLADPLYVGTLTAKKEAASAATTSGQPWRMAGASGDIAVLGAGTCLDPEVGSVGATGNAEANIRIGGARVILENMRKGMSPDDAGLDALSRIAHWYKNDMAALKFVEVVYYILRNDGAYSCVSLWRGDRTGHMREFTIHDGVRRAERCLFLYDGNVMLGCGDCKPLTPKAMHDLDTDD
ncbi:MAG TPA: isoaspartyl peptidase/L-asparaginase [Acidobacteriaceae bacterium]|nr:isoaspartyl peptidase/L-asparaginase [Acidobacteriaceae bacterium]